MIKKIALFLLTLLLGLSVEAKIKHPSLLFTQERIENARKAAKNDSVIANGWSSIIAEADRQLGKKDIRMLEYPAMAYLMTGDKKYASKVREVLLEVSKSRNFGDREMLARKPAWRSELQMAHKAFQSAMGYDAIYDYLTPSERKQIAEGLNELMVEPLLGDWFNEPTRIHSLNSMGHNWWTACLGMGAILGLSLSNELPGMEAQVERAVESLSEWFDFSGDVIQHKPQTFDGDGGMYESINYASFGISEAMFLRLAWLNSHPGAKPEDIPAMNQVASFFCYVAYPRTGMMYSMNFGDSHKNVTGERAIFPIYAMGVENPETLWYASQIDQTQFREGLPYHFPMGLLYTPDLSKAPSEPPLPKSHLWKNFGWATMRDSWDKDATMLAVKSGMTWNHSHADANSLILFHNGEDIIKDAGNCSYGKPEYRKYFFQSDAHNVVRFNGEGQPTYQQYHGSMLPGSVSNLIDGGNIKYVLADGTGPMSHVLNRNFRHFLWIDNVIYVIDDLHSHKPGNFEWIWHPGGKAEKKGYDLEITNGNSAVLLRPLYPRPLAYSNFVHDYPEDLYWETHEGPTEDLKGTETYWSFHLPAITDQVKGVTAIILKDSVNQKKLPVMERREGKDWIGLRITDKGKVTDLYINQLADGRLMHMNSWIDADGWTTDAYMFAVSYPEGGNPRNPDEIFIGHGSALRQGDDVYFASLSKLNLVGRPKDKNLDLVVGGQPHVNFAFKSTPSSVSVNGIKRQFKQDGKLVRVKYKEPQK